jgi:cytochrome c peroxidase
LKYFISIFFALINDVSFAETISLGHDLFFDKRLSASDLVSCASCHSPARYFADGEITARGEKTGRRNSPTITDMERRIWFMWDGRSPTLEHQMTLAIEGPAEHGFSRGGVAWIISRHYKSQWTQAFGKFPKELDFWLAEKTLGESHALPSSGQKFAPDPLVREAISTIDDTEFMRQLFGEAQKRGGLMQSALMGLYQNEPKANVEWTTRWTKLHPTIKQSIDHVFELAGIAIASFVKGIHTIPSKTDKEATLSEAGQRGRSLFHGKAGCAICHSGPDFTDDQFHNIGLRETKPFDADYLPDLGRAFGVGAYRNNTEESRLICKGKLNQACLEAPYLNVYGTEATGSFKTPSLRNVARTAPYMHNGSLKTLEDVLNFYNDLPTKPSVGKRSGLLRSLGFTSSELNDLKEFLQGLSSPVEYHDGRTTHVIQ